MESDSLFVSHQCDAFVSRTRTCRQFVNSHVSLFFPHLPDKFFLRQAHLACTFCLRKFFNGFVLFCLRHRRHLEEFLDSRSSVFLAKQLIKLIDTQTLLDAGQGTMVLINTRASLVLFRRMAESDPRFVVVDRGFARRAASLVLLVSILRQARNI